MSPSDREYIEKTSKNIKDLAQAVMDNPSKITVLEKCMIIAALEHCNRVMFDIVYK